jgi:hypothetical protein
MMQGNRIDRGLARIGAESADLKAKGDKNKEFLYSLKNPLFVFIF